MYKEKPKRLVGFGLTTPSTGEKMGAQEVERCIKKLEMKGIILTRTKILSSVYRLPYKNLRKITISRTHETRI